MVKKVRSAIKLFPNARIIESDDTRAIFCLLDPI
jgi:hypothetical protein